MDKTIELDRRGAELKAELARYRKWFRTRAVSLGLKRAAVAFVDEGVAIGMWPGHAAGLIGSTPPTIASWRAAITQADMEATDAAGEEPAVEVELTARLLEAEQARDAAQAEVAASKLAIAEQDDQIEALEEALFMARRQLSRVRWLHARGGLDPGSDEQAAGAPADEFRPTAEELPDDARRDAVEFTSQGRVPALEGRRSPSSRSATPRNWRCNAATARHAA